MTMAHWLINLRPGGQIIVSTKDGTDLTSEEVKILRMLVNHHFQARVSQDKRGTRRPEADEEVMTKTSGHTGNRVKHQLDPIVNFLTVYRRRRWITLESVSKLCSLNVHKLTGYETGHSRPFIEALRDWGYSLGFNIMPIPVALSGVVKQMVNAYLADAYADDLNRWGNVPRFLSGGDRTYADLSPGREFLRDSDYSRPEEVGEAAGGDVPDSARTRGSDEELG